MNVYRVSGIPDIIGIVYKVYLNNLESCSSLSRLSNTVIYECEQKVSRETAIGRGLNTNSTII